ncbi:MAG: hypothetical protein WCK35_03920 [Chloroflexota bacterium]
MSPIARTRADVDLHTKPKSGSNIMDRLPGDCQVEILEDLNGWFKVKPVRMIHGITGYLPEAALLFLPEVKLPIFPILLTDAGLKTIQTVPASLKVNVFVKWLAEGGKPEWMLENVWQGLSNAQQAELCKKIWSVSAGLQPRWDEWLANLKENGRLEDARIIEWIVMSEGGREMYAIRDHYIYLHPLKDSSYFGCALTGQTMRWTGAVRSGQKDGKLRDFYEVDFYRMSRYLHGWFRADIVGEYIYPTPELDPTIENNSLTVFDLSQPMIRYPQDSAIEEARKKGYSAAQYIDVFGATNKHLIHFSLCGEFCVAALSGKDVVPLLKAWADSKYFRFNAILNNPHEGTSAYDLQRLLDVAGFKGETYNSIPTTPQLIKERLESGQLVIAGCGINSGGKLKADGKIRHWVVLEDIIPAGNSGWVRVYNPFLNREEVYTYSLFLQSVGVGAGLWVTPKI